MPVVDLPLGATEDRVVGALDLERALAQGEKSFEPGLLARANRGFLYIDEVNLLEDHLVDLLIDVAASGENVVEREGLSVRHPARFVLIGSGNPEEGELRPQLLDRFGLSVEVSTPTDLPARIEVMRRRDGFERDPAAFVKHWAHEDAEAAQEIVAAREALPKIEFRSGAGTRGEAVHGAGHRRLARRTDADPRRARARRLRRRGASARASQAVAPWRCAIACAATRWTRRARDPRQPRRRRGARGMSASARRCAPSLLAPCSQSIRGCSGVRSRGRRAVRDTWLACCAQLLPKPPCGGCREHRRRAPARRPGSRGDPAHGRSRTGLLAEPTAAW